MNTLHPGFVAQAFGVQDRIKVNHGHVQTDEPVDNIYGHIILNKNGQYIAQEKKNREHNTNPHKDHHKRQSISQQGTSHPIEGMIKSAEARKTRNQLIHKMGTERVIFPAKALGVNTLQANGCNPKRTNNKMRQETHSQYCYGNQKVKAEEISQAHKAFRQIEVAPIDHPVYSVEQLK